MQVTWPLVPRCYRKMIISDVVEPPVCYFSNNFNQSQRKYSTIEKECLVLTLALRHFDVYFSSSSLPIVVATSIYPAKIA